MTTFEHAMLGANGIMATGLHRRYGWQLVVLAAGCAIVPDWDGLTILYDVQIFDRGHRVWGHNFLACILTGFILGSLDHYVDIIGRTGERIGTWKPLKEVSSHITSRDTNSNSRETWCVWVLVAILAALSQIPADAVVSSGHNLSDWPLKPCWPFSDSTFIYPMVSWGDPGITLVFCLGMIATARWRGHLQFIAGTTLMAVVGYILLRGHL